MAKYFDRFPLVSYSGSVAKNLMIRVDFTQATKNDLYSKFDYVLDEAIYRPDLISDTYYGSPYYDWLIYMQNNIVDPYHDFYKSESDLQKMIISKYGSVESATRNIIHYRNNWAIDDGMISQEIYDNLAVNLKKYYKPNVNLNNQIIGYSRVQEDWIRSTNKAIQVTLAPGLISTYEVGDVITQSSTSARGTIKQKQDDKNILLIQHITGTFETSENILEINTGPTEQYVDTDGTIKTRKLWQMIPDDEAPFWAPVTAYEDENEKNVLKRYVTIIKDSYLQDIDTLFTQQVSL